MFCEGQGYTLTRKEENEKWEGDAWIRMETMKRNVSSTHTKYFILLSILYVEGAERKKWWNNVQNKTCLPVYATSLNESPRRKYIRVYKM